MHRTLLAALCLAATAAPASAVDATAEEATRLVEVFHRYLGAPQAGQADHVRAEPQGTAYRITLDLGALARPFEPAGFHLENAELSFLAEPLPEGTWHVSDLATPSVVTLKMGESTTTFRWEGVTFEGVYDPALAAFTTFDQLVRSANSETSGPTEQSTSRSGEQRAAGSAQASPGGGVDATLRQSISTMSVSQRITLPPDDGTAPAPFELSYGIVSAAGDATLEGLQAPQLLELWAYVVSKVQQKPVHLDGEEIKGMARGLIPIFRRIEEKGSLQDLTIETPFGGGGIEDLSVSASFTGIVPDAGFDLFLKLSSPSYPDPVIPPWARQLLPSELEFGMGLAGINLEAAARHVIDVMDIDRSPILTEEETRQALLLAAPEDGDARFTLHSGHIEGPLASLSFEGEIRNFGPTPSGTFKVDVAGLDAAIAALQAETADPRAQQLLGALTLAQMSGARQADGTLRYLFEANRDGSVTLNGAMIKPPGSKDL